MGSEITDDACDITYPAFSRCDFPAVVLLLSSSEFPLPYCDLCKLLVMPPKSKSFLRLRKSWWAGEQ